MGTNESHDQKQTSDAFGFKWRKRTTYESAAVQEEWRRWLLEKYFDGDDHRVRALLRGSGLRILDAGCGSGGSALLLFGDLLRKHQYYGVDISDAVDVASARFLERGIEAEFLRSDVNTLPETYREFDFIFSEGVLHHTDSVENALSSLAGRLKTGGKILFYVYAKKAPVREFTDDHIRREISALDNDLAWDALMPLTRLGKVLGELNIQIDIEDDIPYLGIERGSYSIQRLFYYKFCKAYFRPDYSLDEMNHINFDWFRPLNCHRHSPEEIQSYCESADLLIERMHVEESGITVIAERLPKSRNGDAGLG